MSTAESTGQESEPLEEVIDIPAIGHAIKSEVMKFVSRMQEAASTGSDEEKKEAVLNVIKEQLYDGFLGMGLSSTSANEMKDTTLENIDLLTHHLDDTVLAQFNRQRHEVRQTFEQMKDPNIIIESDISPEEEIKAMKADELVTPSTEEIESIYATAYQFYNANRYSEAMTFFKLLVTLKPKDHRFHFALASSFMLTGDHEKALGHFVLSHYLKPDQPLTLFFLAKCNVKLGHLAEAKTGFIAAKKFMDESSQFTDFIKQADSMIELISNKLALQE